jgi:hypothetical protein
MHSWCDAEVVLVVVELSAFSFIGRRSVGLTLTLLGSTRTVIDCVLLGSLFGEPDVQVETDFGETFSETLLVEVKLRTVQFTESCLRMLRTVNGNPLPTSSVENVFAPKDVIEIAGLTNATGSLSIGSEIIGSRFGSERESRIAQLLVNIIGCSCHVFNISLWFENCHATVLFCLNSATLS